MADLPLAVIIDHNDCSMEAKELQGIARMQAFGVHTVKELPKEANSNFFLCEHFYCSLQQVILHAQKDCGQRRFVCRYQMLTFREIELTAVE